LRRRWQLLSDLKPAGGHLLDVGCGSGDFLAFVQAAGRWKISGLEPNAAAARAAREGRGLNVKIGQLPDATLPARSFDVITLWHVLEHVPNPAVVLADVRRLLKPEGVLIVGVPLGDSVEANWFKANWAGYDVPRHLVTFTHASLSEFAQRHGFYLEEQRGIVQGISSLRISLGMWLGQRDGVWRRLRRLWLMLLLPPLYLILRLRSGSRVSVGVFVGCVVDSC
jgi:SAM-dependent methyltransferase